MTTARQEWEAGPDAVCWVPSDAPSAVPADVVRLFGPGRWEQRGAMWRREPGSISGTWLYVLVSDGRYVSVEIGNELPEQDAEPAIQYQLRHTIAIRTGDLPRSVPWWYAVGDRAIPLTQAATRRSRMTSQPTALSDDAVWEATRDEILADIAQRADVTSLEDLGGDGCYGLTIAGVPTSLVISRTP